jgi:nucleoside-diphosphate-sugar epimerase
MILLTGATGFVGSAVARRLAQSADQEVIAAVRRADSELPDRVGAAQVAELSATTDWTRALRGVRAVVHAAARVHVMKDRAIDPLVEFRKTNVEGTLALARQAVATGVERFIFISSVKVNGESTRPGDPFVADDPPAPVDPYAISKFEAELGLRELARGTGMSVTVIRQPLVYGPGVKANFHAMMRWLRRGIPLPLGAIDNKRSLVALDNLVDLVAVCCDRPEAANQTFLVSDGDDLSTTDLLRRLAAVLNVRAKLIPIPARLLEVSAAAIGRSAVAKRLVGCLQVDISKTRDVLNWQPPVSVDEGLRTTADWFLAQCGGAGVRRAFRP